MTNFAESTAKILSQSRVSMILESYTMQNIDHIADIVVDMMNEYDVCPNTISSDQYDQFIHAAAEEAYQDFQESVLHEGAWLDGVTKRLKNFVTGSQTPQLTRVNPKRVAAQQPEAPQIAKINPKRVAAQQPEIAQKAAPKLSPDTIKQVKGKVGKVYSKKGWAAKRAVVDALLAHHASDPANAPDHIRALANGALKLRSRTVKNKDGSFYVKHSLVDTVTKQIVHDHVATSRLKAHPDGSLMDAGSAESFQHEKHEE